MALADNLVDFAGGNDKERDHLNALIAAIKENATDIQSLKSGGFEALIIQDTKLKSAKIRGVILGDA